MTSTDTRREPSYVNYADEMQKTAHEQAQQIDALVDPDAPEIIKAATISDCGLYRYRLTRKWAVGPLLPFIMLNPSTADASIDDPTIRRCMSFARRECASGIVVGNLFGYRTPSPKELWQLDASKRHGLYNEHAIYDIANDAIESNLPIVCAWGAGAGNAAIFTTEWLKTRGAKLVCLGRTQEGHPRHPLYVKGSQPLEPFHGAVGSPATPAAPGASTPGQGRPE